MINKKFPKFCCEDLSKIENYDKAIADTAQTWDCHHRLETHNSDGERRAVPIYKSELIALGMYYNRPSSELIFLTVKEHRKLHNDNEVTRIKISKANIGKQFFNNGEIEIKSEVCPKGFVQGRLSLVMEKSAKGHVGMKHSKETKKILSEKLKGRYVSEETKQKQSENIKGLKFFNNGEITIRARECPEGFVPGNLYKRICSEETKAKQREAAKHRPPVSEETKKKHTMRNLGRKWWNNGIYNVYQKECPEGFVKGKLIKQRGKSNEC